VLLFSFLMVIGIYPVFAFVMKSESYRMQSDSINVGGKPQSSANYLSEDTIGEIATSESTSSNYKIRAGYQAMQEVYISLSSPGNVSMNSLDLTQNTSVGTGNAWSVKTDNPAGYILNLKTDETNCLKDNSTSEAFTDDGETPATWSVTNAYEFGFSIYGNDVSTATWGTDTDCTGASASAPSTTLKYRGFKDVTAIQVATSNSRTSTSGTDTVFCVAAEQNGVYAPSGNYTADITATAIAQ